MDSTRKTVAPRARASLTRRLALAPLRLLFGVALRLAVTSLVFFVCAALALHALGYELPSPSDFGEYFDGVERLADLLS